MVGFLDPFFEENPGKREKLRLQTKKANKKLLDGAALSSWMPAPS
jgi:hypothetical protein